MFLTTNEFTINFYYNQNQDQNLMTYERFLNSPVTMDWELTVPLHGEQQSTHRNGFRKIALNYLIMKLLIK